MFFQYLIIYDKRADVKFFALFLSEKNLTFCTFSEKYSFTSLKYAHRKAKILRLGSEHDFVKRFPQYSKSLYNIDGLAATMANQCIHQHEWLIDTGAEQKLDAARPV